MLQGVEEEVRMHSDPLEHPLGYVVVRKGHRASRTTEGATLGSVAACGVRHR